MQQPATAPRLVEIATLGERLSALRLCDAGALTAMRRSLEQHGQLCALTLFVEPGGLEIVDGFKRVRAARALGWSTLLAYVDEVGAIEAKLRIRELHDGRAGSPDPPLYAQPTASTAADHLNVSRGGSISARWSAAQPTAPWIRILSRNGSLLPGRQSPWRAA